MLILRRVRETLTDIVKKMSNHIQEIPLSVIFFMNFANLFYENFFFHKQIKNAIAVLPNELCRHKSCKSCHFFIAYLKYSIVKVLCDAIP